MREPAEPQSIQAEQSLLGALVLMPEALSRVSEWISERDFSLPSHRLIYRSICSLSAKSSPVDAVTIAEWLEANELIDRVGGGAYVSELAALVPGAANVVAYAEIVLEKSRLRQLLEIAESSTKKARSPLGQSSSALASDMIRRLSGVCALERSIGPQQSKAALKAWFNSLVARYDAGQAITGIQSPWAGLDQITNGWQPGELIVVAARPNVGKSVFGFNQLAFSGLNHQRAVLFSLEMSQAPVMARIVAATGEIPHDWLRSPGSYDGDYWSKLSATIALLQDAAFLIDDQAMLTAEMIIGRVKREHLRKPVSMVIIDHLHEMARSGRDMVNEIAGDCRALKALAKDLSIPVILLAQLNRQGSDRPTLKDLRASGGIEEVADIVLLLHRDDYQKEWEGPRPPIELIIAKGRNIPSGGVVYLKNRFDIQRLDSYPNYKPGPRQLVRKRGFGAVNA